MNEIRQYFRQILRLVLICHVTRAIIIKRHFDHSQCDHIDEYLTNFNPM